MQVETVLMESYFKDLVDIMPDFILPLTLFDPEVRKEGNLPTPLLSKIKPHYDEPGAYIFFEPCNQNNKIEVMYVGRSLALRNRIRGHWGNYTPGYNMKSIIEEWSNYCWENDFPYDPHVAVFVHYGNNQELKDLEHYLMQLKPKLNIH